MARTGNNPKRRIAAFGTFSLADRQAIAARLSYVGSANHKRQPGDYGFHPPTNPRPSKSLCDAKRCVLLGEAQALMEAGILKGMMSTSVVRDLPKYVWSVDDFGEAYEAKMGRDGYHGYRLESDDTMRDIVLREWAKR
jgi:hypothetical protein